MKTAIIINGFLRTWSDTYLNFLETFSHLNADVFVSTYDQQYGYASHIINLCNAREDYILTNQYVQSIFEPVKPVLLLIDNAEIIDSILERESPNIHPLLREFKGSYGQSRKLKIISDAVRNYEDENNFKYDVIIKTRADLIYNSNIDLSMGEKDIIIDSGNKYPNDWFFMVNREDYYYVADYLYYEFINFTNPTSAEHPPHKLHENAFNSRNLNIKPRHLARSVLRSTGEQVFEPVTCF